MVSQAAEQGYANAQQALGLMYEKGWGLPTDQEQAIIWYRKAAKQGWQGAKVALKRLNVDQ